MKDFIGSKIGLMLNILTTLVTIINICVCVCVCVCNVWYSILMELLKCDKSSTPHIDRTISKKTLYSSLQRYNTKISRETSWFHRLRHSRLYNYLTTCCFHTFYLLLSYSAPALSAHLFYTKNGATFQNCRLIATYHLDELRRLASSRASIVFPAVVCSGRKHLLVRIGAFDICRHR